MLKKNLQQQLKQSFLEVLNHINYQNEIYQNDNDDLDQFKKIHQTAQKQTVITKTPVLDIIPVLPDYSTLVHR